jgi:hypothetical protein
MMAVLEACACRQRLIDGSWQRLCSVERQRWCGDSNAMESLRGGEQELCFN